MFDPCPCGSARPENRCCGPFVAGAWAPTAEALMRSRYTAYVRCEVNYLLATHDPRTRGSVDRAATLRWARESTWLGLSVLRVSRGGPDDEEGEVDFEARFTQNGVEHVHGERSRFAKLDGRWFYLDGRPLSREVARREVKPSPNAPCPCGSGKKYKRCHGPGERT